MRTILILLVLSSIYTIGFTQNTANPFTELTKTASKNVLASKTDTNARIYLDAKTLYFESLATDTKLTSITIFNKDEEAVLTVTSLKDAGSIDLSNIAKGEYKAILYIKYNKSITKEFELK